MKGLIAVGSVAVTAIVLLCLGGPDALRPFEAAAQAVSEVSVAFVVDFSGSGGVQSACVEVPATDNEYQALDLFTEQEHEAAPTYNSSGLLCSIGGVPVSGCGQSDGDGFIYWSYWHGDSGSWEYSDTGAGGIVHSCNSEGEDCDLEGWKFEDPGRGNPSDPPPQLAANYSAICSSTTSTTTATPTTTTSATAPTPTTTPTTTSPHPAAGASTTTTTAVVTTTSSVSPQPSSHPPSSEASGGVAPEAAPAGAAGAGSPDAADTTTTPPALPEPSNGEGHTPAPTPRGTSSSRSAEAAARPLVRGGSAAWVAWVAVLAALVVLGTGSWRFAARRGRAKG